jgi:hypothetical protein
VDHRKVRRVGASRENDPVGRVDPDIVDVVFAAATEVGLPKEYAGGAVLRDRAIGWAAGESGLDYTGGRDTRTVRVASDNDVAVVIHRDDPTGNVIP